MKKNFLFLSVIITCLSGFSQKTGEYGLGAWYMYFGTHKINERFSIHSEAQLRMFEPVSNFFQFLPRVGLNYHINSYSSLTAGYALIPTSSFEKSTEFQTTFLEHRIWQQFVLKNFIGRVKFYHRYRFEQRWIETNSPGDITSNKYVSRLRYFFKISVPLNNEELVNNTFYAAAYNELFMNIIDQPFDQNRLYFALGLNLNENFRFETGYQSRWTGAGSRFDLLQFAVFIKTGTNKNKAVTPTN